MRNTDGLCDVIMPKSALPAVVPAHAKRTGTDHEPEAKSINEQRSHATPVDRMISYLLSSWFLGPNLCMAPGRVGASLVVECQAEARPPISGCLR